MVEQTTQIGVAEHGASRCNHIGLGNGEVDGCAHLKVGDRHTVCVADILQLHTEIDILLLSGDIIDGDHEELAHVILVLSHLWWQNVASGYDGDVD